VVLDVEARVDEDPVGAREILRELLLDGHIVMHPQDDVVPDAGGIEVAVQQAIVNAHATPVYLPTYSPELNPIELWWGDIKRALRRLALDSQDQLAKAVRRLRAGLRLDKIRGWFRFSRKHATVGQSK
jgi:transposase